MEAREDLRGASARAVAALNAEQGWRLTPAEAAAYTMAVVACAPDEWDEPALLRLAHNYHQDHPMVVALQEPQNPQHELAWSGLRSRIIPMLCHAGVNAGDFPSVDLDDLTQMALDEVMKALASFRFESRFSTWSYTVVVRRGRRYLRDLSAAKRSTNQVSLDHHSAAGAAIPAAAHPEVAVVGRALAELVDSVLTEVGGMRLAHIFRLWAQEDMRLVDIGHRVGLSTSRVSVLLDQARQILQHHHEIRSWRDDLAPPAGRL